MICTTKCTMTKLLLCKLSSNRCKCNKITTGKKMMKMACKASMLKVLPTEFGTTRSDQICEENVLRKADLSLQSL